MCFLYRAENVFDYDRTSKAHQMHAINLHASDVPSKFDHSQIRFQLDTGNT